MLSRRMYAAVTVAAGALVATSVVSTPASADVGTMSWEQCNGLSGFCMWQDKDATGRNFFTGRSASSLGSFDNKATSFWNRTASFWCVYQWSNYGGGAMRISPQQRGHFYDFWNDNVSSVAVQGGHEC
jgi:hypothetical protein